MNFVAHAGDEWEEVEGTREANRNRRNRAKREGAEKAHKEAEKEKEEEQRKTRCLRPVDWHAARVITTAKLMEVAGSNTTATQHRWSAWLRRQNSRILSRCCIS